MHQPLAQLFFILHDWPIPCGIRPCWSDVFNSTETDNRAPVHLVTPDQWESVMPLAMKIKTIFSKPFALTE